jgi:hypothetical protein
MSIPGAGYPLRRPEARSSSVAIESQPTKKIIKMI